MSAYSLDIAASIARTLQLQAVAQNDVTGANFYGGYYTNFTSFAAKARTAYTNASNGLVHYDGSGNITNVGANSHQGDCVSALYFDMIPSSQRSNVLNLLLNATNFGIAKYNVRYTNDGYNPVSCTNHLSTGYMFAAREMLELSRNGYTRKAYELLMDTNFPSWLYPVVNGTTTSWEDWNTYLSGPNNTNVLVHGPSANDRGHYPPNSYPWIPNTSYNCLALGAIAEWVWKVVGGISPDDASPGYKNMIIKPEPGGALTNAVASLNSIRGPVVTSWTNNVAATNYTLNVTVPANATASVYIPSTNLLNITESGVSATSAPGIQSYYFTNWPSWSGGATVFQVGAGAYQFKASGVTF